MAGKLIQRSRAFATISSVVFLGAGALLLVGWSSFFPDNAKRKVVTPHYSSIAFRAVPPPPAPQPPSSVQETRPVPPPVEKKVVPKKQEIPKKKKSVKKRRKVQKKVVKKTVPKRKLEKIPPKKEEVAEQSRPPVDTIAEKAVEKKTVAPPPAQAKVSEDQIALAVQDVRSLIDRVKKYPKAAQRAGYGGIVKLRIELTVSGVVTGYSLVESSGRRKLDDAALKAAEKIMGKKATLATLSDELAVTVPVRFSLIKSR